ncbi:Variant-specific surface protein, partial [Giardia duodenalis]
VPSCERCYNANAAESGVCREARDGACGQYEEEHTVNGGRHGTPVGVRAAGQCTDEANQQKCAENACNVQIGSNVYCSQCKTGGNVPIDGVCKQVSEAANKCQKTNDQPVSETDTTCGKCLNAYFMYKGGCYSKDAAPGSTMCTEAADGKCSAAATGYFVPPAADRDNAHQSVIPCGSEEEITAGNSHKYRGVANCKVCTAPENGDGADSVAKAATCTACVDGYYGSGNPLSCAACDSAANCATCSGAATACTSCKTSETANGKEYFRIKDNAAKTGECVTEAACKDGTHFPTTTTDSTKICASCSDETNSGIADCATCTKESNTIKCLTCTTQTNKPNKAGTKCFDCQVADCSHCSADGVCEECNGKKVSPGGSSCVTACPDNSTDNKGACICNNGFAPSDNSCGASSSSNLSTGAIVEYL